MISLLLLIPVDTPLLLQSFPSPRQRNVCDVAGKGLLSTLRSPSVRWLLHKHEMKCSLLVPPAFENPNLIELNYFLPSFHVEPHIYIRGIKLIFRVLLYCFPMYLRTLQLPVCAVMDSSASVQEMEEEKSLWLPLRCFVVCACGRLQCARLMCVYAC